MDRYKTISQLSSDVLGQAHLGDDTMLQRKVILRHIECAKNTDEKLTDQSWKGDFSKFAGKLAAIKHPNMLTIYDLSVNDEGACVISQYVEGETLADRLTRGPISQVGVYRLASDILEVMHSAHEFGVFHGGLHTGSIIRIKRARGGHRHLLSDLGLDRLASIVKRENVKLVDPVLIAPELTLGAGTNAKADLFMLGQICYTALVGGHPYFGRSAEECFEAYKSKNMPALDTYVHNINPALADWVMRMVEFDPKRRFDDSEAAIVALQSIQLTDPEANISGVTDFVHEQEPAATKGPKMLVGGQISLPRARNLGTALMPNTKSA